MIERCPKCGHEYNDGNAWLKHSAFCASHRELDESRARECTRVATLALSRGRKWWWPHA